MSPTARKSASSSACRPSAIWTLALLSCWRISAALNCTRCEPRHVMYVRARSPALSQILGQRASAPSIHVASCTRTSLLRRASATCAGACFDTPRRAPSSAARRIDAPTVMAHSRTMTAAAVVSGCLIEEELFAGLLVRTLAHLVPRVLIRAVRVILVSEVRRWRNDVNGAIGARQRPD